MNTCMLKKRKSQLSITMIIMAIIGLIILVVIVTMLSGRFGAFSEGADDEVCAGENLWAKLGWGEDPCAEDVNGGGGNGNRGLGASHKGMTERARE